MSIPATTTETDLLAGLPELPPRSAPDRRLRALETPHRARRPRLMYGIIAVAGAVLIGAAQMGVSILSTQSSYEISALAAQQRDLAYQKQMLADSIAGLSSPQYLAANAADLGMVTGERPTYLRLSDASIVGSGTGSKGTTAVHAFSKAAVGNALLGDVPLVTDPTARLASGARVTDVKLTDTSTPPPIADGLPTPATH